MANKNLDDVFTAFSIVNNAVPNYIKKKFPDQVRGEPFMARDLAMLNSTKYPASGARLGKQDAARHLAWTALMTKGYGGLAASLVGDAHESFLNPFFGAGPEQTEVEKQMDTINNPLGIEIGKKAKSPEEIFKLVDEYIASGKAKFYTEEQMDDLSRLEEIKNFKEGLNNPNNRAY